MPQKPTYEELEARVQELERAETARKSLELEQAMFLEVLQLINETETLEELLSAVLNRLKHWSGCEAVGIRLKDGPDFPYFGTSGFPDEFVELERHLCVYGLNGEIKRDAQGEPLLECMCGNILCGRFDPTKNFFTSDGSFWSNCTTELLASTTDADRQSRTRNRCNSAGYESVALIPLRSARETFGLIQLNDHRRGLFSPERIATYRRIADHVASFLAKRQARDALRKSEAHLRALLDSIPDLIWLKDPKGAYLACNHKFERFFGAAEAHIVGKTDYDFVDKELADFFTEKDKAAMAAGGPSKNEEEVIFADDGHREFLETIKTPIYDAEGRLTGVLGISRDITQRKLAQEALEASKERFRAIFDNALDGILLADAETKRFHSGNKAICRMLGYTQEEIGLLGLMDIHLKEELPFVIDQFERQLRKEISLVNNVAVLRKDGTIFYADINASLITLAGKTYLLGIFRDITERKLAEEARQYQERLLREMGSIAKVGGWEFNPATGKGTWTEEVARIHDLDPLAETNMELGLSFYHGKSRAKIIKATKSAIELGQPYDLELELVTAKGIHKWVHTIGQPKLENGQVVQVRGSFQDITASKAAEQRIEHLNRVLKAIRNINKLIVRERDSAALIREGARLLVHNRGYASALIIRTDENEKPISWACAGLTASAELLDAQLQQGALPPCCDRVRSEKKVLLIDDRSGICGMCPVAGGCAETISLCVRLSHAGVHYGCLAASLDRNMRADAEELGLFAEVAGDLAYALHALQSEKKRNSLEKQLIQAQKMESVGRLAGGVAHDYNNMLSIITGYTEMALEGVEPGSPRHADLQEVLAAARRSTDITRQLLAFARKQTIAPKVLDLNQTVESILKMLRRLIGEDIDLAWLPGRNARPVKIDPSQIDQILANLCVNARDAISGVGKITIETCSKKFDEAYCAYHEGFVPGQFVMLAVSDDGCGIAPKVMSQIFEPFFTTKPVGEGTGLGLATVYGIVKQNNGFINVYSEPEKGTTIRIYLPQHSGKANGVHPEGRAQIPSSQGETILLVEDDKSILKLGARMLNHLGYTILTASTPSEAMALAKQHSDKIDLMITDVVMPEMNGRELAGDLQTLYPDMKILFMSGYTSNVIAHRGVLEEAVRFIPKPFSLEDLSVAVRATLAG
jgi:PAS domain S-box-containing protein